MKPNCPYLKSAGDLKQSSRAVISNNTNNSANNSPSQSERLNNPNPNNQPRPPLVTQSDITKLEARMKQQVESMERRMLDVMRNAMNASNSRQGQTKAVRSADEEMNPQSELAQQNMLPVENSHPEQQEHEWQQQGRQDHVKISKIAKKKQLSLLECGGHQITKELEFESAHSVIHVDIYVEYLRRIGNDVDSKALAKALRAKRSIVVCLKDKEYRAFGPVQVEIKIDLIEIVTFAWVNLDLDLLGQILIGRNELSLRAVGQPTGVRSATIDQNATMTVRVQSSQGIAQLRGMLDTGAGVSVLSAAAWKQLGAPVLKPWTVPITTANDQAITVLGITSELYLRLNELDCL